MSRVLVAMPLFNAKGYLSQAIDSVLAQTYAGVDLLILDDRSTDGSWAIAQARRHGSVTAVRTREANSGPAAMMNDAIDYAARNGYRYLARMDADDISEQDRVAAQVRHLEQRPELIACGTNAHYVSKSGDVVGTSTVPKRPRWVRWELERGLRGAIQGTLMLRVNSLADLRYREDFRRAEDTDFLLRLSQRGRVGNLCGAHYRIRFRDESLSVGDSRDNVARHFYALYLHRCRTTGRDARAFGEFLALDGASRAINRELAFLELWRASLGTRSLRLRARALAMSPKRGVARFIRRIDCLLDSR